jgi:ring-1,2-phenylacetyl-CoA epoxidase subunit PaaD
MQSLARAHPMAAGDTMSTATEQAALEALTDPEIPVVTLRELGILRDVNDAPDGLEVVITPTYSGCPAMGQIEDDVGQARRAGMAARVVTRLSPRGPPTG